MSDKAANLVRMVNQIAANLAVRGEAVAIEETAKHIRLYWDPRMRHEILMANDADLSKIARVAITRLPD